MSAGLRERSATDWFAILTRCGVRADRAERHQEAFHQVLRGGALSRGEEELDDFLGQILHESGMLASLRENLNYTAENIRRVAAGFGPGTRWHEAGQRAEELAAAGAARIGEFLYHSRNGNGPEGSGDGYSFRGGAHIMLTFRDAYEALSDAVGNDLVANPGLVEMPIFALQISVAWWERRVPDSFLNDLVKVTKRVNGGTIGIEHRRVVTATAARALQETQA